MFSLFLSKTRFEKFLLLHNKAQLQAKVFLGTIQQNKTILSQNLAQIPENGEFY